MKTHFPAYSVDAGSSIPFRNRSSASRNIESSEMTTKSYQLPKESEYSSSERKAYDEFCLTLKGAGETEDVDQGRPSTRRLSYVQNWRREIVPLEINPPSSPFAAFNFPTSPVAIINPEQLCVTSLPPYDLRTTALLPRPSLESLEVSPVDGNHLYYDAELERMLNELEASSVSSSTISATIYLPPIAPTTEAEKPSPRKSAVRWLPARIKYSLLSSTFHKVFRR
ncbi:hypothetical protein GYMLUDRAFT_42625 [Collybiopsis luxurians FD-317 M1]|uniref:Uncharacterized protein n=1 Tax=Collybiopsis luxurians FD-317 M1 TaxID=944289 RepID=A0A0D0CR43_9AGAR|nr:hypothetical protein GYMLUDRAFT_42625 [Collybiopsis luxurians FD-317 M1]